MGKHNAPSKSTLGPTLAKAGILALGATGPLLLNGGTADAATSDSILNVIAQCESGNRNIPTGYRSTASGYFQILDSTWSHFGGREFASRALHASRGQQLAVAQRILAGQGISAWNPSKSCWGKRITTANPVTVITPKPQQFKVDPPKKITPKTVVKKVVPSPPPPIKVIAQRVAETYLIRKGDTLSRIAHSHHSTVRRLASLNSDTVKNPNRIYYGRHLRLA